MLGVNLWNLNLCLAVVTMVVSGPTNIKLSLTQHRKVNHIRRNCNKDWTSIFTIWLCPKVINFNVQILRMPTPWSSLVEEVERLTSWTTGLAQTYMECARVNNTTKCVFNITAFHLVWFCCSSPSIIELNLASNFCICNMGQSVL